MLELLTQIEQQRRQLTTENQRAHAQWTKWLHWAKQQPGYEIWKLNEGLRDSDTRSDIRHISKKYVDIEYTQTMNMGIIYLACRRQTHHEKELLTQKKSDLLKTIWFKWKKGQWVYTLEQIANALNKSINATHKDIMQQPWYETRQAYRQRKFSTQHSRPTNSQPHLYGTKIT